MKLKEPVNKNYCATVSKISSIIPLDNCNNVVHGLIMGNLVIVDKSSKVGDIGLYFPVECALSNGYLSSNSLYRHKELNVNKEKTGYFEDSGRIKSVKFRGHVSQGLFMPLSSLFFTGISENDLLELKEGDEFDFINDKEICRKYVLRIKEKGVNLEGSGKKEKHGVSKIVDGQFRFHDDTNQFYKNYHKLNPSDLVSISVKIHGTSAISSKILCKRNLNWFERLLKKYNLVRITDTEYTNVVASRKTIKSKGLKNSNHYYGSNIWEIADTLLKDHLDNGMTIYYEIAGYTEGGGRIQGGPNGRCYNYGCVDPLILWDRSYIISEEGGDKYIEHYIEGKDDNKSFKIFVYRITYTNDQGKVFEFSMNQIRKWCKLHGINVVPELYYGKSKDLYPELKDLPLEEWQEKFFLKLKNDKNFYMEEDCPFCNNGLPFEGVVLRIDSKFDNEAYKVKCERFYNMETKMLDSGVIDIEIEN